MNNGTLVAWLNGYKQAWETRSPAAIVTLFTEDARYWITPFHAPLVGRASIAGYWEGVAATQRDVRFEYDALITRDNSGVAHWTAAFYRAKSGKPVQLDGVFVLEMNAIGQCMLLREWWHSTSKRHP